MERISWISHKGLVPALLLVVSIGCLPMGEDSWQHYKGGGHYPARTPDMSPDGSVIVFSSPRTGSGDIYQINRDGTRPVRLTNSDSFETDPIFSFDGSTIAFARESDGRRHVWLMDADGSNQRQLTSGRVLDDPWVFSPDGSELTFLRSPLSIGMGREVSPYAVNLVNKQVRILEGLPVYSPDGARVAYALYNEKGESEIWIMDRDQANGRFVAAGHSPRFSPDGNTILYSTENTNPGKMWKMVDVDGANVREFGRVEDPVFASDGEHVLCLSPKWQREIWRLDLNGENLMRLDAPTGDIDFFRPCRDGFMLRLVGHDRVGDVYVVDTQHWTVDRVASMRLDSD